VGECLKISTLSKSLYSRGPGEIKVPAFRDHITFMRKNRNGLYRKAN
jgi:hypothetical protein